MRIKLFAERVDAFDAKTGYIFDELLIDEFEAFAIILVLGFAMRGESVLKTVNHGDEAFDDAGGVPLGVLGALLFDALAIVVKIGLTAHESLAEFVQVASKLCNFHVRGDRVGREFCVVAGFRAGIASFVFHTDCVFLLGHFCASPLEKMLQILLSASLNSWAT